MKTIHKLSIWCVLTISALLSSCDIEAPYIREDTAIHFRTENVLGTQMRVFAEPEDDRAYYYYSVMTKEEFESYKLDEFNFMTIIIDSLYRDYLDWRSKLLRENETYITTFRSFSFHYGKSDSYYINLKPNTDYLIYGFTIDPENIQFPVGQLYTMPVRTGNVDTSVSKTVFDFSVTMTAELHNYQGDLCNLEVSVRPSKDGHLSREPYIFALIPEWAYDTDEFDHNPLLYLMYIAYYAENGNMFTGVDAKHLLYTDISSAFDTAFEGQKYFVAAAAYRESWYKALYTLDFEFQPVQQIPYTHYEKTDYEKEYNELLPRLIEIIKNEHEH